MNYVRTHQKIREGNMRAGLVMNSESLEYGDHLKKVAIHAALIRHDLVSEVVQVNHSSKV